jgi:hypothetical protein
MFLVYQDRVHMDRQEGKNRIVLSGPEFHSGDSYIKQNTSLFIHGANLKSLGVERARSQEFCRPRAIFIRCFVWKCKEWKLCGHKKYYGLESLDLDHGEINQVVERAVRKRWSLSLTAYSLKTWRILWGKKVRDLMIVRNLLTARGVGDNDM